MYGSGKPAKNAKYNNSEFIGKQYGRLTVIGIEHIVDGKYNRWMWRCSCSCGKEGLYRADYVHSGHTSSCGCARKENKTNFQHGETKTRLHSIWNGMRARCTPGNSIAHWHGDRGITVCEEWNDYAKFAEWARSNGYRDDLSIERIDNNGDYCPENCKWILRPMQARNRRTTMYVDYFGERISLAEACERSGVPYKQTWARIKKLGWKPEDALTIAMNETRHLKKTERPGYFSEHYNEMR